MSVKSSPRYHTHGMRISSFNVVSWCQHGLALSTRYMEKLDSSSPKRSWSTTDTPWSLPRIL
eukprot:3299484-Prymnesium_polylepis.1